jgi:hypothetical protein
MARRPPKKAINREELARLSLEEIRLWPGCESVASVGVLWAPANRFTLRVVEYGATQTTLADRAIRAIERVKLREYYLRID